MTGFACCEQLIGIFQQNRGALKAWIASARK
jgi:hypothetical protein